MKKKTTISRLGDSLKIALAFQLAWLAVAGLSALTGHAIDGSLLVINLVILLAPVLFEILTKTKLPIALQVHFHIFVTAASLLGSILGFYGSVPNWDTYVHLDSAVLTTWLGLFVVRLAENHVLVRLPKWFVIVAAVSISMGLASLWEIYEFLSDLIIHTNMQVGGLEDTMIDMMAAAAGALIALVIAQFFKVPKSVLPKALH